MTFEGQVAIVTGAGVGIGRASALAFAREGACVVVVDRNAKTGSETAALVREAGGKAVFVRADVSRARDVAGIARTAARAFGGADILHNNAGVQHYGTVTSTPEREWDAVLGVNLKSVYLVSRACIPLLRKRGGGAIVNTSSVQAFACQARVAPYTVTKAGIVALTRSMALDYAKDRIRVNCVCPGTVDTPMLDGALRRLKLDRRKVLAHLMKFHPIGRIGKPEDIAELVLFLAGPRASFITGASILIDGGLMAQLPVY